MEGKKISLTPYWLLAATFVGLADTLYLSYYKWLDIVPGCAIGGCETVLTHPSSVPWGIIPLAYLGLIYYIVMLVIAVLLAINPESKFFVQITLAYTTIGLLCSVYFELYQYFAIGALCMYCGISALTTLLLFGIALWHYRSHAGRR